MSERAGKILIAAVIICAAIGLWLNEDRQAEKRDAQDAYQQKRTAEALLMDHLPEGYLEEIAHLAGTDTAAIWPQGGSLPMWVGTVDELRHLLRNRPSDGASLLPQEETP